MNLALSLFVGPHSTKYSQPKKQRDLSPLGTGYRQALQAQVSTTIGRCRKAGLCRRNVELGGKVVT